MRSAVWLNSRQAQNSESIQPPTWRLHWQLSTQGPPKRFAGVLKTLLDAGDAQDPRVHLPIDELDKGLA